MESGTPRALFRYPVDERNRVPARQFASKAARCKARAAFELQPKENPAEAGRGGAINKPPSSDDRQHTDHLKGLAIRSRHRVAVGSTGALRELIARLAVLRADPGSS